MKIILSFCVCATLFLACSDNWSAKDEQFAKVYTEIVVARERFPEKKEADDKVAEILQQNGFSEDSFKQKFMEIGKENPEKLRRMVDSAHSNAARIIQQGRK